MMKARLGAALFVALLSIPAAAHAQAADSSGEDEPAQVEQQDMGAEAVAQGVASLEERGGPLAPAARFAEYELAPEVENRFATTDDAAVVLPPTRASKALMLAGAALLVTGLIIGDDAGTLVAVIGAGIGAYGVYLYFE